jgi:hypothetical protein
VSVSKRGKQKTDNDILIGIVVVAATAIVITATVLATSRKAEGTQLFTMCPLPSSGDRIAMIVGSQSAYRGRISRSFAFATYDAATGKRTSKVEMEGGDKDPLCLGRAAADAYWVYADKPGLHVRSAVDGSVVTPFSTIVSKNPGLQVGVRSIGWDFATSQPTLFTNDARAWLISSPTLLATRHSGQVGFFEWPYGYADAPLRTEVVDYYVNGDARLQLADHRRVTLQGHPRSALVIDGRAIGKELDFYMPNLLKNPSDGSVEWADPPSLLVAEETKIGSMVYDLHRVTLDGTVVWTHTPKTPAVATWRHRPVPWTAITGGSRALHVEGSGMTAIDVKTGKVVWHTGY